jgi:hypothetical protein
MSEPDDTCKGPLASSGGGISTFLGVAITIIAVIYSTITAAGSSDSFVGGGDEESNSKDVGTAAPAPAAAEGEESTSEKSKLINQGHHDEDREDRDDETEKTNYSYSFFHLTYAMAAMYLAMLFSNWKTVYDDPAVGYVFSLFSFRYGPMMTIMVHLHVLNPLTASRSIMDLSVYG